MTSTLAHCKAAHDISKRFTVSRYRRSRVWNDERENNLSALVAAIQQRRQDRRNAILADRLLPVRVSCAESQAADDFVTV